MDIAASGFEIDNSNHFVIIANFVTNCGSDGISTADSQFVTIEDNHLINNGQQYSSVTAFANASGVGVAGTLASPNGPQHISIRGNKCIDNQVNHTQQYGVEVILTGSSPPIPNLVIDDNDFTGCAVGNVSISTGSIGGNGYIQDNTNHIAQLDAPFVEMTVQAPTSTGSQVITGLSFTPRNVELSYSLAGGPTLLYGRGCFDGTSQACDFVYQDSTGAIGGPAQNYIVNASNIAGTAIARASVTSFNQGGMTLNWSNVTNRLWMLIRFYR